MSDILSDALLKTIAEGSGRCYGYEGRAMARELIEWRRKAAEAAKTSANTSASAAHPLWGLGGGTP